MPAAMPGNAGRLGFGEVVAPVCLRAERTDPGRRWRSAPGAPGEAGLPCDPWLRVQSRAGGVIEAVAPASMTVSGSLAQWRDWTGLHFGADGPVGCRGAGAGALLGRARCAVCVEPNVWVRHRV
ncbi:hypothetical protein NKH18_20640 [Streptomyces sp. M10(2022)]